MANYIIIKNTLEHSVNFGKIKKIELPKKGGGMFMETHARVRQEYDKGFFMRSVTPETIADRKKRKMALVSVFKNGKRMELAFEYTLQNKKIDVNSVFIDPLGDNECPHCGNDEIEFDGDRSFGSNEASQEVYCPVCECHWHNVYKFKEVQILN